MVSLTPEFQLAIECCRWNFHGATPVAVERRPVDWMLVLRLARFHRVQGLVWNCLKAHELDQPESVARALSADAAAIAADSLVATAVCRQLLESFSKAGLPLLFLKGLTLGALAYRNPALKSAIDIDVVIDPKDLGKAAEILRDAGFRLIAPDVPQEGRALHDWHRGWKESVWAKSSPRLQVDLHTRTADSERLIPGIDVHSPRQMVTVGAGLELPTLAADALFAYLAIHGAATAWFRLKWISDFAALLHGKSNEELDRLYRRSQQLGAGRAGGQALLLADELFGTLQANLALREEVKRDRSTRRLYRIALRQLASHREPVEPTDRLLGTAAIHLSQFLLIPGLGYKLSEVARQIGKLRTKRAARRAAGQARGERGPDAP